MTNAYLEDNLAPTQAEHTVFDLEVSGAIPAHLDGRYLRNGPNPMSEVDPDTYHWFLGDGMVHGLRLRDGKAQWYRNRWVRTPKIARQLGETLDATRKAVPVEVMGANTNVIGHNGRTLALVEGGTTCHELDEDLRTVGPCDFDGTIRGGYTAHPKRDPQTGELHAVSYFFGRPRVVQYSVIGVDGRARRTVDVPVSGNPMMHDMSLTEKYVVFYDLPVTFNAKAALSVSAPRLLRAPGALLLSTMLSRTSIPSPLVSPIAKTIPANGTMPYRWDPSYPARVGVMPREGSGADVQWFDIEPCYVFHPLNAYDEGDSVVLDVVRHPKMFAQDVHGPNEGAPTLERWVVDLTAGKVTESRLDDRGQEFPRIDERLLGRRHRFGYSMAIDRGTTPSDAVLKHDLTAGSSVAHNFGAGKESSEFVFVANSPDSAEDDGILMGFVFDRASGRSNLELLDAGSMQSVATVAVPYRVPHGFHGNWVPTD